MSDSRLDALRSMAERFPEDPRAHYFLAHELFKAEAWAEAARHYRDYLRLHPGDEGAAFRNLGVCLERLGSSPEAEEAWRKGIVAARSHGHDGLAAEIEDLLEDLAR